eukprot:Phypoly_transcript_06712.p1 GENE.Phypoly_transcript_06712~~Phypoly_transcript_06712.p1  ORF type:complete len:514 (-),score=51.34 Phypoly_transcript_06712:75-1616(-)
MMTSSTINRPALLRRMSFHYTDVQLAEVVAAMKHPTTGIKLKEKRYFLKAYAKCFTGVDAVNWLAQHLRVSKKDAEKFGQILLTRHYIHHICYKHHFEDKYIFFRFTEGTHSDFADAPFQRFPELLKDGEVDFVILFKMMIDEENGVDVRQRKKGLKSYSNCFVGSELVSWISSTFQLSRNIGVDIGAKLMADGYISHVTESYPFADENFYYRFNYEMAFAVKSNRRRLSIGLALASFWLQSDGKPFKETLMDVVYKIGSKSVSAKAWVTLENDGINVSDHNKAKQITKILLQDVVRIHRSLIKHSFTITTQLQQKLMLFNPNPSELGDWQLAVDAFKYPNHFSGTCMDAQDKAGLLRSLFYDGYKGGLIKSHDEEEWTYSNGLLSMCDPTRKVVVAYRWDGQSLTNVDATASPEHEEVGKWDGVRIAWMDGSQEEPDSSLTYIFHEGEYQNQDPSLNWKWTRHFLASVNDGNLFWAVNGSVPPPIVMFLQILRIKKQIQTEFNAIMNLALAR